MSIRLPATGLPDVALTEQPVTASLLEQVGMSGIALPFTIKDSLLGNIACHGYADSYVNICQPEVKGIHMSRLYLLLDEFTSTAVLAPDAVRQFMQSLLSSQQGISDQAYIAFRFNFYLRRPALQSQNQGWKAYPAELHLRLVQQQINTELRISIPYSSTCPCSASLSRQLLEQAMQQDFHSQQTLTKEALSRWLLSKGSYATPHSQRSYADVRMQLNTGNAYPLTAIINTLEYALATAVQTAVKRQDEQEFARLNGHNLMFCEDAARRLKQALNTLPEITDFWLKAEHHESLHAHNAVAVATKGIADSHYRLGLP
ncbi:GTP cyclohydrolase FolE2 [Chromatiaceae bacterium AAb-1]|nr:GTP cyclohydrolase FolE2 [Chromatiaceae bacterium AAb-1]